MIGAGASYSFIVPGSAYAVVETDGTEPAAETYVCGEEASIVTLCEGAVGIIALGYIVLCQDDRCQQENIDNTGCWMPVGIDSNEMSHSGLR